jgi:formylglycine-generating enzyme required for sulfatase activity
VKVRAAIVNGTAAGTPYTQDFDITITPKAGDVMSRTVTINSTTVNIDFHYVPAGSFQRDDTAGNISVITKGYWMAETEVTQDLFTLVMTTNPSHFTTNPEDGSGTGWKKLPVEGVSWYDAIAFCNKLSISDTGNPMYALPQNNPNWETLTYGNIPTGDNSDWNYANRIPVITTGYRLPTEMEWLWAAMGADTASQPNTTGYLKRFAGDNEGHTEDIDDYVWYAGTSDETHQVGKKAGNELGLKDMSGNVNEWCWDWSRDIYPLPDPLPPDYQGPPQPEVAMRQTDGGRFDDDISYFNNSKMYPYISAGGPTNRVRITGFRLVFSE